WVQIRCNCWVSNTRNSTHSRPVCLRCLPPLVYSNKSKFPQDSEEFSTFAIEIEIVLPAI
ncbi:MAG: hypothetical protein WCI39_04340, partial [Gallionellaceae bacterium]